MNNRYETIKTTYNGINYLIVVDKEADIKKREWCYNTIIKEIACSNIDVIDKTNWFKIIGCTPRLDNIPLIEEFDDCSLEDNCMSIWKELTKKTDKKELSEQDYYYFYNGYKTAKQEGIEDLLEFLHKEDLITDELENISNYVESHFKPKFEFVVEQESKCWCMKPQSGGCVECFKIPKITGESSNQILCGVWRKV